MMKNLFKWLLIFGTLLAAACGGTKNVPYYKVPLAQYEDYTLKFNKLIDYLKNFDNDAQTVCNAVLTDLIVFEEDILKEMEIDNALTPTQLDTLDAMRRQVRALRRFMDCLAWCNEYPAISEQELATACELLNFTVLEIDKNKCGRVVEVRKERFLYYFLINKTQFERNLNYSFEKFNGGNDSGIKTLKPDEAGAIFGVFNDFTTDWIIMRTVLCN